MARNTDFIGFTFNGCHSSEFNIYSVSDGSRYQDILVPNPIDYTEQVPGGVGQYYFGSDMDIKEFPLSIAYDKLTETQVRELRNWLAPDAVGELIFDERPYKTYTAKISSSPSLSFICFDSYNKESGRKERIYKGEGSINFVCYYPLGVVSGDKKQLGWYREQIDDRIYRSIGGSSSIIDYKLENNEIAIFEKIKGNTLEIGSGDKSPDNPYNIVGSNPTKVTMCGRNLATNPRFDAGNQFSACVFADCELQPSTKYTISLYMPEGEAYYTNENLFSYRETPTSTGGVYSVIATTKANISKNSPFQYVKGKGWIIFKTKSGTSASGNARDLQIEFGDTATPYEPYTGQTITLPALASLYGDGTVCDEYDVVSGVETRRWGRVVFDGTEKWNKWREDVCIYSLIRPALVAHQGACNAYPIFKSINWNAFPDRQFSIETKQINFRNDACADVDSWKAYLNAQATAGTPVTVVYQLDEPVITKIEEILPFSNFLPSADSGLIINANPEYYNYFTDSNTNISLRLYGEKYSNIEEWAASTGMIEDLDTTGVNKGYDHYITLPDNSKGIQLFNPGDKDTDFILSFNKPTPMNDILFTLSNGEQFMLNLRSSDTDVEDYGAVSDAEKRIAAMTGGVITIDTKKNRIMYKYGTGENVTEESIYFALKKGQFFKIPKNRTPTGGYNLVIGTTSNIETDSIKISYDYLYY